MRNEENIMKFMKVLNGLLNCKYKVTNEVYFDKLLTHLSRKDCQDLLNSNEIFDWIEVFLNKLSSDENKLNPKIIAFTFDLCALIIQNEWSLVTVKEKQIGYKLKLYIESNTNHPPAIKLSYVHFIASIAKYSVGIGWIKENKAWKKILDYCQNSETVYVNRDAMSLIYDILYKLEIKFNDKELFDEILGEIVQPLLDNVFKEAAVPVDDIEIQKLLLPNLNLIGYILQKVIECNEITEIANHFDRIFHFETNMWKLSAMTQNEKFLGQVLRIHTYFIYAKLSYKLSTIQINSSIYINQFGIHFFNIMKFCISRRSTNNVLMLLELNYYLWNKLGTRVPEEITIENEIVKFENQLITFHLVPVMSIFRTKIQKNEEIFDNYFMKLFSISCKFTLRICYSFRDILHDCPDSIADLAYKSIHGLISIKSSLHQDRAVLVFQALVYALKEFAPESWLDDGINVKSDTNLLVKIPNVLSAVLVGLHSLVKIHRITWKESIESTHLLNIMLLLLNNPNITTKLAVESIKLTQLSIEHFLSPNMALLVNNLNESGMQNLGPMITKRLHDISWEVRDSTLELVTSISNISLLKFPVFQEYIIEQNFCQIVLSMAQNDIESYVRASALKCIYQMIMINVVWEKCLNSIDLVEKMLTMLNNEAEGIVRMEIILVISRIYDQRNIQSKHFENLISVMAYSSVNDLHWEVKINALYFWQIVICKQFQNQGMIDGNFPTVTFSKEHKKIITLTEKEILSRIKKILDFLSQYGCLGIIIECLNDESDLKVIKSAIKIIKRLLEFLNMYNYFNTIKSSLIKKENNIKDEEKLVINESKIKNDDKIDISDEIIDSILNSNDINLLAAAYNQMNVGNDKNLKIDNQFYKKFANIKPEEFLIKIYETDLDLLLKSKIDWLEHNDSFDSLLEDMLFSIENLDINDVDCY